MTARNSDESKKYTGTIMPPEQVLAELSAPVSKPPDLSQEFGRLTTELARKYHINQGVLLVRHPDTERLAAVTTWQDGDTRDGLSLSLPDQQSLFQQVARDGNPYVEEFADSFSGNFFERKLLLTDRTRSFVIHPLKTDGRVVGLLAYSSEKPTAFAMFEEGAIGKQADRFANEVVRRLNSL